MQGYGVVGWCKDDYNMSLKELSEHPELASEEDLKAMEEAMNAFKEFGKRSGLIEVTKEDKYNPTFAITEDGLAAIRLQNYSNQAQTALFNLQTQRLNDQTLELGKRAVKQNWMMLVVAVASALAAIVSVFIALKG